MNVPFKPQTTVNNSAIYSTNSTISLIYTSIQVSFCDKTCFIYNFIIHKNEFKKKNRVNHMYNMHLNNITKEKSDLFNKLFINE